MPRLPYPKLVPEAYRSLLALGHYINTATALEPSLIGLIYLRASELNHCGFCIGMHKHELLLHHEPQSRIDAVANWNAPENQDAFTPRERAALAWTDAITNIQQSHASDSDFAAVSQYFHDKDLVDLTFAIATINAWNRLGIAFAAEWNPAANPRAVPSEETASTSAPAS
jgi:AhpD family alkylhydroperoxidase